MDYRTDFFAIKNHFYGGVVTVVLVDQYIANTELLVHNNNNSDSRDAMW